MEGDWKLVMYSPVEVANNGWVKSGLWDQVQADIAAVAALIRPAGVPLKVIFETSQLGAPEIQKLVVLRGDLWRPARHTGRNGHLLIRLLSMLRIHYYQS